MKIRSIVSSKKIAIFTLFVASILATLLIFDRPHAIAQGDLNSFLTGVRNSVAKNCQSSGSQCSSCAENLARNYIKQYRISDRRTQQAVYNAAISGCR